MKRRNFFFILVLLIVIIGLGPRPDKPQYNSQLPTSNLSLHELSDSIDYAEATNNLIKINNEARIVWADSTYQQTEWAIVYLHGFTASQMEGDPVHRKIAKIFGMNLYLARLSDHGIESDSALVHLTPDRLWQSAKKALMIAHKLGKKVIIMSTSTGGTLGIKLAAEYPELVDGLINYSPNIRINNGFAPIMNKPWGVSFLKLVFKNGYSDPSPEDDSLISQYWNTRYRVEALAQLEELVETSMQEETFAEVKCPVLTMAYYKDKDNQDPTVKVSAMRWMHDELGTQSDKKVFVELRTVGVHPFASKLRSKDLAIVKRKTKLFIEDVLGVAVVQ